MQTDIPSPATPPFDSAAHMRGITITAIGMVILSFDAVLVRLAGADGFTVAFWRGVFIALSLGSWTLLFGRRQWLATYRAGWPALVATVLFGITGLLFVLSVMYTTAANTVVVVSAAPLFAALFTWLLLGERVRLRTWLAIAAAFLGVVLVFYGSLGGGGLLGDAFALATAVVVGANLTLLRHHPKLSRIPLVATSGLVMALLALPGATPFSLDGPGFAAVAVMGLAQMPAAMVLMAVGTRYLPAPEVGLFILVETVLGPLWVWLAVGEEPPETTFLGGGLILATLAVHSWLALKETRRVRLHSVRPG